MSSCRYMLLPRFLSRIVLEKLTTYLWVDWTLYERDIHGREGKKYPGGQLEVFGRELGVKWTFELEFWVQ